MKYKVFLSVILCFNIFFAFADPAGANTCEALPSEESHFEIGENPVDQHILFLASRASSFVPEVNVEKLKINFWNEFIKFILVFGHVSINSSQLKPHQGFLPIHLFIPYHNFRL